MNTEGHDQLFAAPMPVQSAAECVFYHAMDLPESGPQKGHWDLRGRFDDYVGGISVSGRTVLDVGTASGFLSFEAEKRGARVVSVDAAGAQHWDRLPFIQNEAFRNRAAWEAKANVFLEGIKRSYWLARKEFHANTRVHYGNAYEIPAALGEFEVVFVGQVLVHLRDTIEALTSIAARCSDTLVIVEGMLPTDKPLSEPLGRIAHPEDDFSFWRHSTGFFREVLGMLGFRTRSVATSNYICHLLGPKDGVEQTTMVFKRTAW